jgi:DNA-binding transcriptional MerR regulator
LTDLAQEDRNAIVSALRDTEAPVEDTAEELPTEDASPEPEDTERPRDEKGRFKSPEEKIATAQEKFQGDPEKAWQAVVEAQELMGRQAQELGEMRKLVENIPQQINQQNKPHPPILSS